MTEADGATGGSACHCCSAGGYHAGNEVTLEQTPKPDKVRLTLLPDRQAVPTGTRNTNSPTGWPVHGSKTGL